MERFEIYYKPVVYLGHHKSLVYTDKDGNRYIVRGATNVNIKLPTFLDMVFMLEHGISPFSHLETKFGAFEDFAHDFPSELAITKELIIEAEDLQDLWKHMISMAQGWGHGQYQYHPTMQNSNTVVDELLRQNNLPMATLDDWGDLWSPGSRSRLRAGQFTWPPLSMSLPEEYPLKASIEAFRSTVSSS